MVCDLGTTIQQVLNLNSLPSGLKSFWSFRETSPRPVDVDEISDQHTELGLVGLVSPACMAEAKTEEREKEKSTQRKRESRGGSSCY